MGLALISCYASYEFEVAGSIPRSPYTPFCMTTHVVVVQSLWYIRRTGKRLAAAAVMDKVAMDAVMTRW